MIKTPIPLIGLGTYKLYGKECQETVEKALELGYRHIDTADCYENHREVGMSIKSLPREQIFLTTKLWLDELEPEDVRKAVPRFLEELDVDYVDLLLIHWPNTSVDLAKTVEEMLSCQEKGMTRHLGVSNFRKNDLKSINPYLSHIITNQIEFHPYLQRKELVKDCLDNEIVITAYRPIAQGAFETDPELQKIGHKYGKSPSQVVLRWIVQQGFSAIPKAASTQHLKDNFNVFDFHLDGDDFKAIESLDCGKRFCAPEGFPIGDD